MRLRLARPADAGAVRDIYAPYVTDTAVSFEAAVPSVHEVRRRIATTTDRYPWLVCVDEDDDVDGDDVDDGDDDSIVGYAYASAHRSRAAYRWSVDVSVYVAESARRKHVATGLYTALFEALAAQGYVNAYAGTSLPNPASVGFHRAMGFESVGTYEEVGYKDGEWHDVQWLVKRLADRPTDPEEPRPIGEILSGDAWGAALATGEERIG